MPTRMNSLPAVRGDEHTKDTRVPAAAPAPDPGALPHPLTFFLSSRDRERVLDVLARVHRVRAVALLRALNLSDSHVTTNTSKEKS
jgi:hypothetical protein